MNSIWTPNTVETTGPITGDSVANPQAPLIPAIKREKAKFPENSAKEKDDGKTSGS